MAVITPSQASIPDAAAEVEYVRRAREGALDLRAALVELRERFGVRAAALRGRPAPRRASCSRAGLVDELFLVALAALAGGDAGGRRGAARSSPAPSSSRRVELELLGALRGDSELFLRYGVA